MQTTLVLGLHKRVISLSYANTYVGVLGVSVIWTLHTILEFNASRDRGQAIHLLSEGAKQLLRVA